MGQWHAVAVAALQAQQVQGVPRSVLGVQQPQGGLPLVAEECAKDEAAHRYDHDGRVAGPNACLTTAHASQFSRLISFLAALKLFKFQKHARLTLLPLILHILLHCPKIAFLYSLPRPKYYLRSSL